MEEEEVELGVVAVIPKAKRKLLRFGKDRRGATPLGKGSKRELAELDKKLRTVAGEDKQTPEKLF